MSKNNARPKGVHVEVVGKQALKVISAVRKVIKSARFKTRYNAIVYFSLQFEFGLNG